MGARSAVAFMLCLVTVAATVGLAGAAADWADHPENRWVQQSPRSGAPAPGFSWEGSGAYDPDAKQWIHYGGHDGVPQSSLLFTWDLTTGRWQQRFPDTSPPGVCCVDGANVYDTANRRFVRFPGASLGHGWQWSRKVHLKDSAVWLYDPAANEWTNMRPAPYRAPERYSKQVLGSLNAGGAYDARHEVALSFGGQGSAGDMNNLFVYDTYANRLERLEAENPPGPRDGMGICYDSQDDCLVVFGSQYSDDERTWIYRYRENRWEAHELNPHPPGKMQGEYSTIPKMAYDSANNVCLLVAWLGDKGHETWALDMNALRWRKLNPPAEPPPSGSRARNLSYDPALNVFIFESWRHEDKPETWTYRYRKATATTRPAPPTELSVTTSAEGATLAWQPSSTRGVTYRISRAETEKPWLAEFAEVGVTAGATFEDRGLAPGKVYLYSVRAVAEGGEGGAPSRTARTQPRVVEKVTVAAKALGRVEVRWQPSTAPDVVGYNVYRALATIATNTTMAGSWGHNDPPYDEPVVDAITDLTCLTKLNAQPIREAAFVDAKVDLKRKAPESADYRYAVYAYFVRAVNQLGVESGPSPYALTIPSEPKHLLLREKDGKAGLRWSAAAESSVTGYRVYRVSERSVERVTADPVQETHFTYPSAERARFIVVSVDALGQEGQPSSPAWCGKSYAGFYEGEWHQ
jgi:hypothetical protein